MPIELNDEDRQWMEDLWRWSVTGTSTDSAQTNKLLAYVAMLLKGKAPEFGVGEEIRPSEHVEFEEPTTAYLRALQDKEMLDWLGSYAGPWGYGIRISTDDSTVKVESTKRMWQGRTLREAIAAAMKADK